MNKIHLLIILFLICLGQSAQAQYYSVNYDKKTVAAMAAAYNTEAATEAYYNEQVQNILKHYNAAEVLQASLPPSSSTARRLQSWAFGAAVPRTITTAASITWSAERLCQRYGR